MPCHSERYANKMHPAGIILVAILLALVAYAAWLFSPPGAPKPLVPDEAERELIKNVPPDNRSGNDVETFTALFPFVDRMVEDIGKAHSYVHISFFKFEDDPVGRRLMNLMAQKASEGVEVRLLVDEVVNKGRKGFYREMEELGIKTRLFSPMHIPFLKKSDNYRYHRKIVAIDGQVAYIGGMNIAQRYGTGLSWGCWRDTFIRMDGPAAAQCSLAFARDWAHKGGDLLSEARYYPVPLKKGAIDIDIVCSGPRGEGPEVMRRLCSMIDSSERYFWIESPYLIPTPEVRDSLFRAAGRGVDVRILIPPRGDHGILTPLATSAYVAEFLEAGVKVARYNQGYMHSKTAVCDDHLVTVGSTNIDPRSYLLDYEINAFMDDTLYASQMKAIFEDDESVSTYIDKETWARRSLLQRAGEAFAKVFSSEL